MEYISTEAEILQQLRFNCLSFSFLLLHNFFIPPSDTESLDLNDFSGWEAGGGEGTNMKITLI